MGTPGPSYAPVDALFFSGTVHKAFRLGQKVTVTDLTLDDDRDDAPLTVGRRGAPTRKPGSTGTGVRGTASLKDLVDSGILVPGKNKMTCMYKGMTAVGTLADDGAIEYQGKRYNSATAFSIHYKRQITPSKQGDDGWKSVCYDGRPLEHYRKIYLQRLSNARRQSSSGRVHHTPPSSIPQREKNVLLGTTPGDGTTRMDQTASNPEGGTTMIESDRWVQCERCDAWRQVPSSDWEAVQNDPREQWYCEYATWDIVSQPPHTPACKA